MNPFIGTYPCYQLGQNQFFAFAKNGLIRTYNEHSCIGHTDDNQYINIQHCNQSDNAQLWHYDKRVSFMITILTTCFCLIHCFFNLSSID